MLLKRRTTFIDTTAVTELSDVYKGTFIEAVPEQVTAQGGNAAGDPIKGIYYEGNDLWLQTNNLAVAQRVVEAVDGTGVTGAALVRLEMPLGYAIRIPIGRDAGALYGQHIKVLSDTLKNMEEVYKSTDLDGIAAGLGFASHV